MNSSIQNMAVVGEELALVFGDGSEAFLPLPMLRRACPCAACQGEPDAMGRVIRPRVEHGPGAFELRGIQPVGGYALQLSWADGHASGIYSFVYLRKLAALPPQ
jgi:DUF971 family protein